MNRISDCQNVAEAWENWCGITKWSTYLREFGNLGGKIIWYTGYPQSASAIPLCFRLIMPGGAEYYSGSRLKDIKNAIEEVKK